MLNLADPLIPVSLRWLLAHNITSITPWHFISDDAVVKSLRKQYRLEVSGGSQPIADCLPFARRQDCDDVAAFIVSPEGKCTDEVIDVHLTYSKGPEAPGFPNLVRHETFWEWLKSAIDDSAEWATEDELRDIVSEGPAYG